MTVSAGGSRPRQSNLWFPCCLYEHIQFLEELVKPIRFGEKIDTWAMRQSCRRFVRVKAAGQQNRQIGPNTPQCMKGRFTIHL